MTAEFPLIRQINSPADLRLLAATELTAVADELRNFLIASMAQTGGHLAASLGTIELTVALHYIFNTPKDRLIWDVGHQTYAHKVLTGRRDQLHTLRQWQGLAGFTKRSESPYDHLDVGHASTSISAALGMALAHRLTGDARRMIAVIGDGALTAGMAFEALNHAGVAKADMLVVLNDNKMSISDNVGGLSRYLAKLIAGKFYLSIRRGGKKVLKRMRSIHNFAQRWEEHMKGMVLPGTLFEELGFNYIGPIDGHDLPTLIKVLKNMRDLSGPQFLHVVTQKGKGYLPAESNPIAYHGVSRFDIKTGKSLSAANKPAQSYTEVFSAWITGAAATESSLVAITPAMREGSGLVSFSETFPDRFFDVGIAEQHAVTLAAGFALAGLHPVVAIYSTFLQRAYDQVIHDVALQNLPVLFAIDRAGLVGPDGPTHAGSFDIAYLRCIPNLVIMAPADGDECRLMLDWGYKHQGPAAVRYPRSEVPLSVYTGTPPPLLLGRATLLRRGRKIVLFAFGSLVAVAKTLAEQLDASLVNMRFIKPLDEDMVLELARSHKWLVTLEEGSIKGGAGSAVLECLSRNSVNKPCLQLGLPDRYLEHGSREILLKEAGLDLASLTQAIDLFTKENCQAAVSHVIS